MTFEPGDRLGPYEILALLGVGGMGEVYRGRDGRLGRDVALKVISPKLVGDPALRRRFEREARAASALNHPAIVTIYDIGETDGVSWIAMEWVDGRTLRQALGDGPLALSEAAATANQVAEGLAAAHAKGIVHRDLKPENVMVAPDGRVKILDFGLARQGAIEALNGSMSVAETAAPAIGATVEGAILGTVGYMSPEQASGQPVDFRSDQFAFGLLLYEMLAGRKAFARPTAVETLWAIIKEEPPPPSSVRGDIPEPLLAVIDRCLAKQPGDRYASTRDLLAALRAAPADVPAGSPSAAAVLRSGAEPPSREAAVPIVVPASRWARLRGAAAYAIGLAVVLALGVGGWVMLRGTPGAIDSLAVLPFDNRDSESGAEYLGDELAESLIDQMSRLPSLKVMARGTVFRFKGAKDPQEAGRTLGVGAVLTGAVSRRGDQLAISVELIDVASGARLWGQRYDRRFADLLTVQDTIAAEIADALRLRLSPEAKRTLVGQGTDSPEAYEAYLKARYRLFSESEEDDLEARRLFQQAVEKDPRFVEAHLAIASTHVRSAGGGYVRPVDAWPPAEESLRKALALDPTNVGARAFRANILLLRDWNWSAAEREFGELVKDPRLFLGNQYHPVALYFWARGRPDESVALLERALRVDPGNLESRVMLADFLGQAGRIDDAIASYRALVEVAPSDARPLFGLAELLRRRNDIPGAIERLRKAYELSGDALGVKALAGARTEEDYTDAELAVTRARLENLDLLALERYVSPLDFAALYAQLGDRERAFAQLDAAVAERSPMLILLKVAPAWDRIRDDPRFAAIVRRVGIP